MAKHFVADHTGHTTIEFDKANAVDLEEAMRRFEELTEGRGGAAATRKTGEEKYRLVRSFDETEDETLFLPHLIGG